MSAGENASVLSRKPGFVFLMTDAELGMTFTRIALTVGVDSKKRERNRGYALRAYEAVLYHSGKIDLTNAEKCQLDEKLGELRSALAQLGSMF